MKFSDSKDFKNGQVIGEYLFNASHGDEISIETLCGMMDFLVGINPNDPELFRRVIPRKFRSNAAWLFENLTGDDPERHVWRKVKDPH